MKTHNKTKQYPQRASAQQGFTLLELLVVVSILAAVAGIGTAAVGRYNEVAREELVHVEMSNIADAIYKFKTDTGYFPKTGVFDDIGPEEEDFSFLYTSPKDSVGTEASPHLIDSGIGWNGPYLARNTQQRMHFKGSDTQSYCGLGNDVGVGTLGGNNSFSAIEDPFERVLKSKSKNINYEDDASCFVIAKTKINKNLSERLNIARSAAGHAYLYKTAFKNDVYSSCPESGNGCIALVSLGKNGKEDSADCSLEKCDDVVKVLRVNK